MPENLAVKGSGVNSRDTECGLVDSKGMMKHRVNCSGTQDCFLKEACKRTQ